jgi:hypothetical protein
MSKAGLEPHLRFQSILQRVIENFGTHRIIFHSAVKFFNAGGMDLFPDPGLAWLIGIARTAKQDQEFWSEHGDETVVLLQAILAQKATVMTPAHRATFALVTDILVDNGVRAAGFLQQQLLREHG